MHLQHVANIFETSKEEGKIDYADPENVDSRITDNLTKLNLQYLETQLSPIVDNLVKLTTREIYEELDGFIQGDYDPNKLMKIAESHDKQRLFNIIAYDWIGVSGQNNITPWTLENTKEDASFEGLLSTIRESLPIRVMTKDGNQYILNLSEGIMAGILFGLRNSQNFSFYLDDAIVGGLDPVAIQSSDFPSYRNRQNYSNGYVGKVLGELVYFEDEDFIRGITTAAKWININPHVILTEITKDGVRITFN